MAEAETAGVLEPEEHRMITAVLRLADRSVAAVMTPRHETEMVDVAKSDREIRKRLRECVHSRVVAYEKSTEDIVGVIQAKDIADALLRRALHHALAGQAGADHPGHDGCARRGRRHEEIDHPYRPGP